MKRGFTLIELMVYMAIVGIIVVIAGEAFSNSTKFRIRTDNMIKASQEAENVATIFKEDVSQMGAKSSKEDGVAGRGAAYGDRFSGVFDSVYMHPEDPDPAKIDSSSFRIGRDVENGFDTLTLRTLRYDTNGYYQAVEEVKWYVDPQNGSLLRSCKLVIKKADYVLPNDEICSDGPRSEPTPITMATGVVKFDVEAATPSTKLDEQQVFPPPGEKEFLFVRRYGEGNYVPLTVTNSADEESKPDSVQILSQFYSNYSNEDQNVVVEAYRRVNQVVAIRGLEVEDDGNWAAQCMSNGLVTMEPNQEYIISFLILDPSDADYSQVFVPGEDHMSVGFRSYINGNKPTDANGRVLIQDFMFFPPLSSDGGGERSMRFTVPETVSNVCLAFTFACYSPLVSRGAVSIKNLKLKKIPSSNYTFGNNYPTDGFKPEENINDKQSVKALKLKLQVSRGAKNGGSGETGNVELIVPTPSNGPRD